MITCSIDSCLGRVIARGLCNKHYKKLMAYGSATAGRFETSKKGDGNIRVDGYHRHHVRGKEKLTHIAIAEMALGKKLPVGAVVHHIDGHRANNMPSNLVICPSNTYHSLIHARQDALDATGDPAKRRCYRCHVYDDTKNMSFAKASGAHYHKACEAEYQRNRRRKQK